MKQVLIVEDQRMPRKYMERMISDSDKYALAASISGADVALAYCKRQMIDLILMDVQMPEMDGYEATRRIRALPDKKKAAIPIVAMTANAFEEDQKNALNAGMNGHIAKPLDIQKLFQVLSELLK